MFPEGNSRNSMASWIRDFMATNLVKLERVTNGEGTRDMALKSTPVSPLRVSPQQGMIGHFTIIKLENVNGPSSGDSKGVHVAVRRLLHFFSFVF